MESFSERVTILDGFIETSMESIPKGEFSIVVGQRRSVSSSLIFIT